MVYQFAVNLSANSLAKIVYIEYYQTCQCLQQKYIEKSPCYFNMLYFSNEENCLFFHILQHFLH